MQTAIPRARASIRLVVVGRVRDVRPADPFRQTVNQLVALERGVPVDRLEVPVRWPSLANRIPQLKALQEMFREEGLAVPDKVREIVSPVVVDQASQVKVRRVLSQPQVVAIALGQRHAVMTGNQVVLRHTNPGWDLPSLRAEIDSSLQSWVANQKVAVNGWQYKTFLSSCARILGFRRIILFEWAGFQPIFI